MRKIKHLEKKDVPVDYKDFDGVLPVNYEMIGKMCHNIEKEEEISIKLPYINRLGYMNRDEMVFLAHFIKWLQPEKVFEIGTFDGLTTVNMAMNCPEEATVYTLDIPEEDVNESKFTIDTINSPMVYNEERKKYIKSTHLKQKIVVLEEDSATFNFSPFKGKIDLFLVDGSHTYEYCYSDSLKAYESVKKGGVILWHDYNKIKALPGVTEALNKLQREWGTMFYWLYDEEVEGGKTSFVFTIKE